MKILRLDPKIDGIAYTSLIAMMGPEQVVATVCVITHGMEIAKIARLFVTEPFRKRGIAMKLLQECERLAAEAGCLRANLLVDLREIEKLRPFYEKRGYTPVHIYEDGETLFSKALTPEPAP